MKTHEHIISWLLRAAMMLVTLTSVQAAMAQQEEIEGGEAFYIYQNDGHFDGFFYDEVKQIRYSRLDTLNREHDHYVSQEIVTEDSVYRIMLTAIDSVSFYQPEIKYAEGVRKMSEDGLMDYFVRYMPGTDGESHTLVFSSALPEALKPKVGEVLTCLNVEGYDGTFVYKVTKVYTDGGQTVVDCGYIDDMKEVFEQFVGVEQVQEVVTPDGSRTTRRRVSGINAPKRGNGNWNLNLFNFSNDFEHNFYLTEGGSLKLGYKLHVGFGMSARLSYKFDWGDFLLHCELSEMVEVGANLNLDGSISGTFSLTQFPGIGNLLSRFSRIPFPAQLPVMNVRVAPEPFFRGELHINGSINTGIKAKMLKQSFTIRSKPNEERKEKYIDFSLLSEPGDRVSGDSPSLQLELNGMVQTGMMWPVIVEDQEFMKRIIDFMIGYTVYAGPKLSGNLTFDVLKGNDDLYAALNKTKVTGSYFTIDAEGVVKYRAWRGHPIEKKYPQSLSMYSFDLNLFPEISNLTYDVTGNEMNEIKAHFYTNGETCWPQYLGVALYGKANDNDEKFTKFYKDALKYETYFLNTYNDAEVEIKDIEAGDYMLRPIIKLNGFDTLIPIYDMEQPVHIGMTDLLLEPNALTVEEEGGEFTIGLKTGHPLPVNVMPNMGWATAKVNYEKNSSGSWARSITVKVNPNDEDRLREDSISVWMVHNDTETIQKSLKIRQYGGLQLSVSKVDFEIQGGEQTVDILTSYNPITINLNGNDDWLSYKLDDRKLTLTAKKNEGIERKATVTVAAWSKKHNGITTVELKVVQKGPVDVSLDKDALTFKANGGSEQVNLTLGGNYAFTGVRVSKVDESWLIVEKHDSYFIATAIPNTEEEEINSVIELVFTKVKQGVPGPATYVVPFYITQEAATPEPKGFTINSLSLGTAIGLRCTNLSQYKERPYEGWEPAKKANMAFYYDNGDEDRSAVITIIDENTLLLECKKEIEETDPEYPGWLTKTVETFTATLTKSKEEKEDEFEEDIIHIRVSDVHHVRDYTEVYEDTKYTNHSEYTIAPNKKLSVMAYPAIYDYDGKLQYLGSLLYNGFRKSYGNVFGTMSFYEEFSWDNGAKVQKYVYANDPDETDGISLQIHFDPDSQWDAWLEDKQVYDAFEARRKQ